MATSAQLLKAQEAGAEIRITIAGQPEGGIVEYSPRHKGDRKPWVYQSGRYVTEGHRYAAKDVAAVTAPVTEAVEEAPKAVTQEMIDSLETLRNLDKAASPLVAAKYALRTLYAAGVFAAIDEADAKQEPFCNCGDDATSACIIAGHGKAPERLLKGGSTRRADAKEAPKNIAARAKEARRESIQRAVGLSQVSTDEYIQCGHCRGGYKPKADGTLRKHACWRYDSEAGRTVFGPLDIHGRQNA